MKECRRRRRESIRRVSVRAGRVPAAVLHPFECVQQFLAVVDDAYVFALLDPAEGFLRDLAQHARAERASAHSQDDIAHRRALAQIEPFQRFQFQLAQLFDPCMLSRG